MTHFLGALKPKADVRDYKVAAAAAEYPESYLCENLPPVKNQRSVSSCVAHATAAILETFNKTETGEYISLSTDFIYGMQGIAFNRKQSGMYLRDACKIVKNYGNATEHSVPGNTEQPKCTEKLKQNLTEEIYKEAETFKVLSYARCDHSNTVKQAIMNYGPVLGSINWYNKYEIKNNVIYFDKNSTYGRHAIMICGWNEKGWICQNSWGKNWNKDGKFIYPYEAGFFNEVWSFVDANNENVIIPKSKSWFKWISKAINFIINLFSR